MSPESFESFVFLFNTDQELHLMTSQLKTIAEQVQVERGKLDLQLGKKQELTSNYEQLQKRHTVKKQGLVQQEDAIAKLEKQVARIRNEKEFMASKKQLEDSRKIRLALEEDLLENEIKIEEVTTQLEALEQILVPLEKDFLTNTASLREEEERATERHQQLQKQHAQLLAKQPLQILQFYKRCKARGMRMPIAQIQMNSCSGCHMLLPPQLINEMIHEMTKPRHCPHCRRLIFWLPTEEEGPVSS